MEEKAGVQPRRVSAVSIRSIRSTKSRKYSTDRHQRQAELSILNEEHRTTRPPLIHEESVEPEFRENFFSKARSENVTSLSRADTCLSPLEIHPGHRIRGFSLAGELLPQTDPTGAYVKPFAEPEEDEQQQIEQRFSSIRRVDTAALEQAHSKIQRSASDARDSNNGLFRRLYNQFRGRRAIKPGAYSGFEFASSLAMSHASAILSGRGKELHDRGALYLLEFDLDPLGNLACAPPKSFERTKSLQQHLENENNQPAFRVIYVCNRKKAIDYLSEAFGTSDASRDIHDRNFHEWIQNDRTSRGSANKAIRWRPSYDAARDIVCSAFGLDFGSIIVPAKRDQFDKQQQDQPSSRADSTNSYHQRLSIYMQRGLSATIPGARLTCFNTGSRNLQPYSKTDTIIISEYSSGKVGDIVSIASLLSLDPETLYSLPSARSDVTLLVIELILSDVLNRVRQVWSDQLALIHDEYAELEDRIYEQPSDVSHASHLWAISQHLHDMLKLVNRHAKLIQVVQDDFRVFAERVEEQDWLDPVIDEFTQFSSDLRTDYIQPLEHLIDLMYKSVTIRDSRQSLDLAASLWRLSWITFIFLPLTFLAGVFGMNVDTFKHDPSIRWYFVAGVPLLVLISISWFAFRRFMPASRAPRSMIYSDSDLLRLRNVANLGRLRD